MSNIVSIHGFDVDMFEVVAIGPVECKTLNDGKVTAGFVVYFKGGSMFVAIPTDKDQQIQFFAYNEMQEYIDKVKECRSDFCAKFRELCEVKDEVST